MGLKVGVKGHTVHPASLESTLPRFRSRRPDQPDVGIGPSFLLWSRLLPRPAPSVPAPITSPATTCNPRAGTAPPPPRPRHLRRRRSHPPPRPPRPCRPSSHPPPAPAPATMYALTVRSTDEYGCVLAGRCPGDGIREPTRRSRPGEGTASGVAGGSSPSDRVVRDITGGSNPGGAAGGRPCGREYPGEQCGMRRWRCQCPGPSSRAHRHRLPSP